MYIGKISTRENFEFFTLCQIIERKKDEENEGESKPKKQKIEKDVEKILKKDAKKPAPVQSKEDVSVWKFPGIFLTPSRRKTPHVCSYVTCHL